MMVPATGPCAKRIVADAVAEQAKEPDHVLQVTSIKKSKTNKQRAAFVHLRTRKLIRMHLASRLAARARRRDSLQVQGLRRVRQRRYCNKVFTHAPAFIQHERAHAMSMPSSSSSSDNNGVSGEDAEPILAADTSSTPPSPESAE